MKRIIKDDYIFGMANIDPTISGIPVDIWSDHKGAYRNLPHSGKRVKIEKDGITISISIESNPHILAPKNKSLDDLYSKRSARIVQEAIDYVGKHYKLFKKHNEDTDNSYNDLAFLTELKSYIENI